MYEKQQAVKAVVDFEIERKAAGFYTIVAVCLTVYTIMTGLIIGQLRTVVSRLLCHEYAAEFSIDSAKGDWHAVGPTTTVGTHSETAGVLVAGTGSASSSGMVNFNASTAFSAADVQVISKNAC